MKSLDIEFDPTRNSLNALRLSLAAAVIISHSWLVNGRGVPPMVGGTDLGLVAVAGFFAISGYLVTSSRLRLSSFLTYLWHRFLRIYPAFLVALVVVAFVFAPLSTALSSESEMDWGSAAQYVLANAGLFIRQTNVDGTLTNSPFPFFWNVPLWTLFYEALCYVVIGVLASVTPPKALGPVLVVLITVSMFLSASFRLWPDAPEQPTLDNFVSLGSFFLAGALLYTYRARVPTSGTLAVLAVALSVALAALGVFKPLAALPIAYVMLYVGSRPILARVGRSNDISYGMYIYGFPVQQLTVIALGGALIPVWLFAIASVAATLPIAWISWLAVEKPFLRLRRPTKDQTARAP